MLAKLAGLMKGIPLWLVAALVAAVGCFYYGAHTERLKADQEIAQLRMEYAESERDALRRAEEIRMAQELEFQAAMVALKRDAAARRADAERVRNQFAELKSRSSTTLEQCNRRAGRCEHLLSEAFSLAGESEELLRDRDARLGALN